MLTLADVGRQFADVVRVRDLARCADATSRRTFHYHVALGADHARPVDLLTVSENLLDAGFAALLIDAAAGTGPAAVLQKCALPTNAYGFDALFLAPPSYHSYFAGRLDAERDRLVLCVPSGNEVAASGEGFRPVVFDRDGTTMVACFTAAERIGRHAQAAPYCLRIEGLAFLRNLAADVGVWSIPATRSGSSCRPPASRG